MYSVSTLSHGDSMDTFFAVPHCVYRNDPLYVPELRFEVCRQLDVARNPFFRTHHLNMLVCFRNSTPVARASLVWAKERSSGQKRAMFGYLECIEDQSAFQTLMDHVGETCTKQGMNTIEGPFSPHHYGVTGVQIDGFGIRPSFLEPYNPQYYARLFASSGFSVSQVGRTWRCVPSELAADAPSASDRNGYTLRTLRSLTTKNIQDIATVLEPAFRDNWRSHPISLEEYAHAARGLSLAFRPGLVSLVEYHGTPVGAIITLLNINEALREKARSGHVRTWFRLRRSRIRSLVVYAMGIVPEHRHSRAALLMAAWFRRITSLFDMVSTTWIMRGNDASERMAMRFGFQPVKTFAVFEKRF